SSYVPARGGGEQGAEEIPCPFDACSIPLPMTRPRRKRKSYPGDLRPINSCPCGRAWGLCLGLLFPGVAKDLRLFCADGQVPSGEGKGRRAVHCFLPARDALKCLVTRTDVGWREALWCTMWIRTESSDNSGCSGIAWPCWRR